MDVTVGVARKAHQSEIARDVRLNGSGAVLGGGPDPRGPSLIIASGVAPT
ncbi:hypothetical protein [Micromonospora sp. ATA51]|nr:hypothetical protein [Micromonospora sp. ATA51]MBM0226932.1 hypothetical protein [Micromonospora sp. ATA51]